MKRTTLALTLLLAFLFSVVAGMRLLGSAVANPFYDGGQVPPDSETYPPTISVSSPENGTAYSVTKIPLIFKVTAPESKTAYSTAIYQVSYEPDWTNPLVVFPYDQGPSRTVFDFSLDFYGVPEGNHSILVQAIGAGSYVKYGTIPGIPAPISYGFQITSSSLIRFTVDTTAPTVLVLCVENKSYASPDVPLNFTVNESVSQITYSLDGQENVTVAGNTTLTGLSNGEHNVTVYATDVAGHVGASETVCFSVEVPAPEAFPAVPVDAVTSVAAAAVVVAGLLVYLKKRQKGSVESG